MLESMNEIVMTLFETALQNRQKIFSRQLWDNLLALDTLVMGSGSNLVHNPYLRVNCLHPFHILEELVDRKYMNRDHEAVKVFRDHQYLQKNLIHALIKTYIDCERMGGGNQFYDKFNHRFKI
jgi:hypothetical protein